MNRIALVAALTVVVCVPAAAQDPLRAYRTSEPPVIDGRLSEESWSRAPVADAFTQKDPDEGKPATERTEIRVMYDAGALYIGARMLDSDAAKINTRLSPRDEQADADRLMIFLDPRHDRRTGVEFWISAAGVQRDVVISNDTFEDASWDAVWTAEVFVDAQGWSAEIRIPFSQLRFNAADSQIWGLNVARYIQRKNETVWLRLVPKDENGLASRMVDLVGIDGVRAARHVELVPYTAARAEYVQPQKPGDPFNDGSRSFGSVGVDLKTRVLGGLTLDATFNPDFGQAEVDPAVVNLSAFETYFEEKRRFFIEGSDIFGNFGIGGTNNLSGFNTSDPRIFYSRRVGRPPQGRVEGEFVDAPRATTIAAAAKLTGKTANGWSIGLLEALTNSETARVRNGLARSGVEVEPRTNYFVARLQRDVARGGVGVLTTSVIRDLETSDLADQLARRAFVFGADAFYFFDRKKDWVVTGKLSGSRVSGTEAAIAQLQRAPQRYYQRPDAPEVSFDPRRTSLSGYAGRLNLNRNEGVWRVNATLWTVSPGFESNDLGFHGSGDRAGGHVMGIWRQQKPDRWTRSKGAWVARALVWNFNHEVQSNMWFACGDATFQNYWSVNGCGGYFIDTHDDQLTRGGPKTTAPRGRMINAGFNTDSRKRVSLSGSGGRDWNAIGGWGSNDGLTVTVKVLPSLTVSGGPELSVQKVPVQYVGTQADPAATATFGQRYVFAPIDQTQLSLTTRVNYIVSPRASLQLYMQPLLAAGNYGAFKQLVAPLTLDFSPYLSPDGQNPFGNPDYNFKSLRLNAVFRWEFKPGSTMYVVWTQQREDLSHPGQFRFRRDAAALFAAPANDIFLVKLTYWIGR
jgi:uncharacterized protein DUF5916/cellulose/xylan binding protein with CBM9 domain